MTMEDTETVVAQTSVPHSASQYGDVATSTGTNALDADNAIPHVSSGAAGKSEATNVNSSHDDLSRNSVNGNDVTDEKTMTAAGANINGVSLDGVHSSESANQQEDGSGIYFSLLDF